MSNASSAWDLSPLPSDSATVGRLKRDALVKLAKLPVDHDEAMGVIARKLDYFAPAALRIRPKETEGGLAPFVYNPIQHDYLAGLRLLHRGAPGVDIFRGIRDIILKPRQLGFTTFIASLYFLDGLLHPGRNCLVLTHLDKVSQKVLEIYRTFYDCLLPDLKATVRLRRASALHLELEFLGPDGLPDPVRLPPSSFMVHTAEGLDLRGITVHNLHCSEAAFYGDWAELVRGVFQAVPKTGNIVLESTANGYNHYKDLVDAALDGKGAYRLVFYPWFAHPEYSNLLDQDAVLRLSSDLDKDERALMLEHKVELGQLAWRRDKIAEMGGFVDSFRQEYPANIQDAFISSGRPIFDLRTVAANWEMARRRGPIEVPEEGVFIYEPFDPGMVVVCGADPSEGIDKGEGDPANEIGGTDYCSAFFLDARTLRTVAHVHGRFEPVEFARKIARVGVGYDALLGVERNNHGHLVLYALEEAGYPRLYRHLEYDAAGQQFLKLGFPMTPQTKPLIVDTLAEVVRRDALPCPVYRFWGEAMVFVRDPSGKAGAMPTRHDDRIISMGIAVYLCTLGAKAWGGAGTLHGADDAGLPRGPVAGTPAPPPPVAKPAPVPIMAGAFIDAVGPGGMSFPVSAPVSIEYPSGDAALGSPAPDPMSIPVSQDAVHPALTGLAQSRAEYSAPGAPRCGNCAHCVDRNGTTVCRPQGWCVQSTDPACAIWEALDGGYTEPEPYRLDIGGPQ